MMMLRILTVVTLTAFSTLAVAGKSGTPGGSGTGSGGVIGNHAMDKAHEGPPFARIGVGLYKKLLGSPATIVFEDGSLVSPDTVMANGDVVRFTIRANGAIAAVTIVKPNEAVPAPATSCGG